MKWQLYVGVTLGGFLAFVTAEHIVTRWLGASSIRRTWEWRMWRIFRAFLFINVVGSIFLGLAWFYQAPEDVWRGLREHDSSTSVIGANMAFMLMALIAALILRHRRLSSAKSSSLNGNTR